MSTDLAVIAFAATPLTTFLAALVGAVVVRRWEERQGGARKALRGDLSALQTTSGPEGHREGSTPERGDL